MQTVDRERFDKACVLFQRIFAEGYEAGKVELAAGKAEKMPDIESVFFVDIGADRIKDGEGEFYGELFAVAGRNAALARRRSGEAMLEAPHPERGEHLFMRNEYRWIVILNRPRT